jgi:hypothetical protein
MGDKGIILTLSKEQITHGIMLKSLEFLFGHFKVGLYQNFPSGYPSFRTGGAAARGKYRA